MARRKFFNLKKIKKAEEEEKYYDNRRLKGRSAVDVQSFNLITQQHSYEQQKPARNNFLNHN